VVSAFVLAAGAAYTQGGPPDHPTVTVNGQNYTPLSIVTRNMGSSADQTTAFPPFKIIDNIYYVGTRTLSSFLIVTPAGHILIDSTYERNVPVIQKSVEQLGFRFADTKILLGNHAHGDHMEGDALVKQLTGAQVMAMAEDVPALQNIKPGGKEHPIDRMLHDGDVITLGSTRLVAHLTAGHTRGCTTFATTARENGRTYNVVFGCSLRAPNTISPAQFGMDAKYAALQTSKSNPFIDVRTCGRETDIQEAMFKAVLAEQQKR
jgi:metallo-beta-lactamase class B